MPTNDFLPYGTGVGANVEPQATYAADPVVQSGALSGLAKSQFNNKALRQGTFFSAVWGALIGLIAGKDTLDDGVVVNKEMLLWQTLLQASAFTDVGSANAILVNNPTGMTFAVPVAGQKITLLAAHTNTGATTINWTGVNTSPVVLPTNAALIGGEIVAGRYYELTYDGTSWQLLSNPYSTILNLLGATPAGAFTNKFYNGTMQVAQRGSVTPVAAAAPVYTLDGLLVGCSGANVVVTQQPSPAGTFLSPYCAQLAAGVGITDAFVIKPVESIDAFPLAGRTCIVQFKVRNTTGATVNPTITIKHANSTDNWAASTTDVNAVALAACPNNATTTLSYQFTANANFGNGASFRIDFGTGLNAAAGVVQTSDWDVRATSSLQSAVPLPELRSISFELIQCQRYLPAVVPGVNSAIATGAIQSASGGGGFGSAAADVPIIYPTKARVPPTALVFSSAAHFSLTQSGVNNNCTNLAFSNAGIFGATIIAYDAAHTYVVDAATVFESQNAAASLILTGAELNGTAI